MALPKKVPAMSTPAPGPDNLSRFPGSDPAPPHPDGVEPPDPDAENSKALFEELDALLERMLALPVSYLEENDHTAGEEGRQDVPLITIAEAMLDPNPPYSAPLPPVSATDEAFASRSVPDAPPSEAPAPPVPAPPPARTFPLPPPESRSVDSSSVSVPPVAMVPQRRPRVFVPPPPPLLLPLIWCNRAFDGLMLPLGPLGHWLRGKRGRAFLGFMGLLMLLAACGLFLNDWFGWTW